MNHPYKFDDFDGSLDKFDDFDDFDGSLEDLMKSVAQNQRIVAFLCGFLVGFAICSLGIFLIYNA